ncbi:MAG: RNA polymerase sigma factor [Parvibaculaceae bacterium]|nr:RNA polymerase sigma factor [Parvibaculaceae bacterium]
MQDGRSPGLRALFIDRYNELKDRLTRRLGSADRAEEALQDTWLRLDGLEAVGQIRNPGAYLFRASFNTAMNHYRAENRRLGAGDIEGLLHIADDAPDAQRVIESRDDLARLKRVMAELPPRQRDIMLAVRLEGLSQRQIAGRFGISVSMVEKELKKAQEYCVLRFGRREK